MDELKPEDLRTIASRYFTVVGIHYDEQSVFLPVAGVQSDEQRDGNFDALRRELMPKGYIPMFVKDQNELGIYITRKPPAKYRGVWVNIVMLCLTLVTTIIAGAFSWSSYEHLPLFSAKSILFGSLFFSFPLMLILGVHELSHYLAARRHGVAASLPFFIPAFPPLGTFGAFISMRDPIPDRKALMDIGVAGPLAGFVMTIFVTIAGLWLTNYYHIPPGADTGGLLFLGTPVFFDVIGAAVGYNSNWILHPTAFAGWVGFLVTSLNLLPAGQLDGGHVARAFLGEKAKYAGWAAIIVLVILSLFSGYPAWIVFILLILFLGLYHPPPLNDLAKLDWRRKGLGALAVIVLVGAFIPVPLSQVPAGYGVNLIAYEQSANIEPNGSVNYTFYVVNTGNSGVTMVLNAKLPEGAMATGWKANLSSGRAFIDAADYKPLNLTVTCPPGALTGSNSTVNISVHPEPAGDIKRSLEFRTVVGFVKLSSDASVKSADPPAAQEGVPTANFTLTVQNLVNDTASSGMVLDFSSPPGWTAYPDGEFSVRVAYGSPVSFDFSVAPAGALEPMGSTVMFNVTVRSSVNASHSDDLTLTVIMGQVHDVRLIASQSGIALVRGQNATVGLTVTNTGNGLDNFTYYAISSPGLVITFPYASLVLGMGGSLEADLTIYVSPEAVPGILTVLLSFYPVNYMPLMDTAMIQVLVV